jgi:hypothetical protein
MLGSVVHKMSLWQFREDAWNQGFQRATLTA